MEGINQYGERPPEQEPPRSGDALAIEQGIAAALAEERQIDDATARVIAAQLHGGQGSALYSLASTGNLADDRLATELHQLGEDPDPQLQTWASVLDRYAQDRGHKGPVDGWSRLWPTSANQAIDATPDRPASVDPDDADARASLLRRIEAAAVTTLGQVATISTADSAYGRDADAGLAPNEVPPEPDAFRWTDAARWHADGGPDELGNPIPAPEAAALHELFDRPRDAECGSTTNMGWAGLVRNHDRPGGSIITENQYGRRGAWTTDSDEELTARWDQEQRQCKAYMTATRGGSARDDDPRIWVGSLSDYVAGYLHGEWLQTDLELDELQDAVQFILKHSHEPDAEEYAVMDYDGFTSDLTSLLGEYPSLQTIHRLGQGIREHGPAFSAWAAYVGPDNHDQLDQFEDHYWGEWESLEAYAEDQLDNLGANQYIEDAPEWLKPYLSLDVGGYARDLGYELHVVEASGGEVWVFST
jgi:antirestriction protein